jgi:hypothetical protein
MKLTRADKRRRKIAKMVEMKLDGMTDVDKLKHESFEQLYQYHRAWKNRHIHPDYYGARMVDVLNHKAQEMQRSIDRAILEELNGKPISTD